MRRKSKKTRNEVGQDKEDNEEEEEDREPPSFRHEERFFLQQELVDSFVKDYYVPPSENTVKLLQRHRP